MKFMKLGSKPDSFQTDVNNVRSVANELATDFVINVGDVKFYLHKFPLLSKCARLQKSATAGNSDNCDEVDISDIPGGPAAFETCAKFCYGMAVTLNAYNVIATRCAAEYLGMNETIEKGNLAYKIDIFLSSSIFRGWKDSIVALQTTRPLLATICDEMNLTSRCVDAVAARACADVAKVDWSYSYNRKKLPEENGHDMSNNRNGSRNRTVPRDWWVEDLCDLDVDLYDRVISAIKLRGEISSDVIGEALKAYAYRRLQGLSKIEDCLHYKSTVENIVRLLPAERGSVSCNLLLKLLKAAVYVGLGEMTKSSLIRRIGQQLEEASISDLMIRNGDGESTIYDVDMVKRIVEEYLRQDYSSEIEAENDGDEVQEMRVSGILSGASKLMVAKLIDGYLAEIARDSKLPMSKFVELAEMVSGMSRPAHDALYRAIDMFLKEHPGIMKSERKKICKLMDCKKLSADACVHAVQNERLPLRVVVQVLFFEQVRVAATSGSSTPDLPKGLRELKNGSYGSSRSAATNPEEDWDGLATADELRALKAEIASLRLGNGRDPAKNGVDRSGSHRMKGLMKTKRIFAKLWSSKGEKGENSGSDSSDSLGSAVPEEAKSTPSRNRRHSVS